MFVSRSMQNQEGRLRSHNMTKIESSNCMWMNGSLDHHQTTTSVGQNQDCLDVETICNQLKIYWNKMDSILIMDRKMYFVYKNLNKTRGTYMIYEDKRRRKYDPKCLL
jgi:hypothetical protein